MSDQTLFTINRPDKDSGLGIYAVSQPVKRPKMQRDLADRMVRWMNAQNGHFKGEHERAYAIAHCQIENIEHPWRMFVVSDDMVKPDVASDKKLSLENAYFEAQVIFNCEILEMPEKTTERVPKRRIERLDGGKIETRMDMVEEQMSNKIVVPEGCMSWTERKKRNKERYHTIKVRYQYITKNMLGMEVVRTFEGWVKGLKAHIIQHEVEHFEGKNMYYA